MDYLYIDSAAAEFVRSLKHLGHVVWYDFSDSEHIRDGRG